MDDVRIAIPTKSTGQISPEERARRKAAIDYARVSMRLEGFILDEATEELNRRYIDGEMTSAEHSAAIRASVGP
jgi:hypothetical protein